MEWSLPDVLDVVTDVVPDRTAMVFRDERRTYASVRERSRNLAAWFVSEGLGVRRERAELERWESVSYTHLTLPTTERV